MKHILMTLFVLVMGCSITYAGIIDVPTGLLHRWSFDGNVNDSIGTNHGTLEGTAALSATGGVGDSGYVSVGPNGNYVALQDTTGLPEWTITAWINNANTTSYAALAAGWEAEDIWYDVRLGQHGTTDRSELGLTDGPNNKNGNYAGATINGVTQWTHLAITGGATDSTVYIDGDPKGVLTYSDFEMSFVLSYDRLGAMSLYEGYGQGTLDLDEVGIWNRQLSRSEILTVIPEPATIALLGCGGLFCLFLRRRRRK